MVPIEQKDWTEEDRASKLGQNHPLDSTKRLIKIGMYFREMRNRKKAETPDLQTEIKQLEEDFERQLLKIKNPWLRRLFRSWKP
jgi:hypothetical protein